jgi:hypothetical protein
MRGTHNGSNGAFASVDAGDMSRAAVEEAGRRRAERTAQDDRHFEREHPTEVHLPSGGSTRLRWLSFSVSFHRP